MNGTPTDPLEPGPPEAASDEGGEAQVATGEKDKKKDKKKDKDKDKDKKGLGSSRGIETMFRTSYRTHLDLSAIADTKANIMISINGIIISVVIASISPKVDANPWLAVPTSALLIGCAISMVYAVLAARPRITRRAVTLDDVRSGRSNILFFGNFVELSEDDFVRGMTELMQETSGLYHNMIRDIYGLGRVLDRKYRLIRTAYTTFMVALVVSVFLFVALFLGVFGDLPPPTVIP